MYMCMNLIMILVSTCTCIVNNNISSTCTYIIIIWTLVVVIRTYT